MTYFDIIAYVVASITSAVMTLCMGLPLICFGVGTFMGVLVYAISKVSLAYHYRNEVTE